MSLCPLVSRDRLLVSLVSMHSALVVMQRTAFDDETAEFLFFLDRALHLILTCPQVEVPLHVVVEAEAAEVRLHSLVATAVHARLR